MRADRSLGRPMRLPVSQANSRTGRLPLVPNSTSPTIGVYSSSMRNLVPWRELVQLHWWNSSKSSLTAATRRAIK